MSRKHWLWTLAAALLFAWGSAHAVTTRLSTVSGQVTDTNGRPLKGVVVSINGKARTRTDAGGLYEMKVVPRHRVAIEFSKPGYASTIGVARLAHWVRVDDDDHHYHDDSGHDHPACGDRDDDHDGHDRGHHHHGGSGHEPECVLKTRKKAMVSKSLLKAGAAQQVTAENGGSFAGGGFKITLPPGSLDATGVVDLTINPIDVSTSQIAAAPGDFGARTAHGRHVTLESFSMAEYLFSQGGRAINLRRGATAEIELLLPATTRLAAGQVTPLWYLDPARGVWVEEGRGTVGQSTTTAGRLAVFGTVRHFSWWNSDQPAEQTAISGRVVDQAGNGIAGASVEGWGVDYAGHSYAVNTGADGTYCIQVRSNSTTRLTATAEVWGILTNTSLDFTADGTSSMCGSGPRLPVPDLVLSRELGCISGQVVDAGGLPVAGVTVYTSLGAHAVTDGAGAFRIDSPSNVSVVVYVTGPVHYQPTRVTAPPPGTCAEVVLHPRAGPGTVACVKGTVTGCGSPYGDLTLQVRDSSYGLLGQATTDASGVYCVDALPVSADLKVVVNAHWERDFTTSFPGTCAENLCAEVNFDYGCW